jgi:hypothetical protein
MNINFISELDKLTVNYFKKENPFYIGETVVESSYMVGSPDNRMLSAILSNVADIKYPVNIINRDLSSFKLLPERNAPNTPYTKIVMKKIVKGRYVNETNPNLNLEIYTYDPPTHFTCNYNIIFFCEYMKHANEFQLQFLERLNQQYVPVKSNKFNNIFFDTVWRFNNGFNIDDNFTEASETKREIKVTATINVEGYYLTLNSKEVKRGITYTNLKQNITL